MYSPLAAITVPAKANKASRIRNAISQPRIVVVTAASYVQSLVGQGVYETLTMIIARRALL
jgi:hypothetical protein